MYKGGRRHRSKEDVAPPMQGYPGVEAKSIPNELKQIGFRLLTRDSVVKHNEG